MIENVFCDVERRVGDDVCVWSGKAEKVSLGSIASVMKVGCDDVASSIFENFCHCTIAAAWFQNGACEGFVFDQCFCSPWWSWIEVGTFEGNVSAIDAWHNMTLMIAHMIY